MLRWVFPFLALVICAPLTAEEPVAAYDASELTPEMLEQTEVIAKALDGLAPDGWQVEGVIERYTPVNMYDKINGRSELFMSYGVIGMTWLNLVNEANLDENIEVYLYDQGSTLNAFGVYSVERWEESQEVNVGAEGYRTDTDLFFRKGDYYACLLGSEESDAIAKAQRTVAEKLAERLTDDATPLWGDAALPSKNRVPNSLKYFSTDAMSLDFLKNTFVCEIKAGELSITHFVSRLETEEMAKSAMESYGKYLAAYGKGGETIEAHGLTLLVGDAGGGYHDVVFQSGEDLAGVTAVKDRAAAIAAAQALHKHLSTAKH